MSRHASDNSSQNSSNNQATQDLIIRHIHEFDPDSEHKINLQDLHSLHLLVISDKFKGQSQIKRQKALFSVLGIDLCTKIHAISLKAMTKEEYETNHKKNT